MEVTPSACGIPGASFPAANPVRTCWGIAVMAPSMSPGSIGVMASTSSRSIVTGRRRQVSWWLFVLSGFSASSISITGMSSRIG